MAGSGNLAARRRKSNARFDSNVTRSVSTASKVAAEKRKPADAALGIGLAGIAVFVVIIFGSSLLEILRPDL